MTIERLDKNAWHPYFDAVSRMLPGKQAEIDVNALDIGAQIEAEFAPLLGITYDHKSGLLEVILEGGLDHTIPGVREISIDHDGVNLNSVMVIGSDGRQQIIRLRDPVMLPPPLSPDETRH